MGERNAPVFRLHGADSRQNGLPDGQSVARVADARHGQIFDADERRHAAACVHERAERLQMRYARRNHVARTEGIEQPVLRLLLNDGARQPCRGRVRALVDIGDDEAGGFAYTRQDGNLARVALRHAERAGHARQDALRDAEVEQQVVRGGAPLCDGFQNASLVLRLPQCAER